MVAAALALAIIAAYAQVRHHQFTNYDDHRYITQNYRVQQGLTLENFGWAFTSFEVANWHPLTWLSHMLDASVFGRDNAGAHHLMNVALHIANAVLVLVLLNQMTGSMWRSAAVTAIFALHPLRVESVAWVSERKDVLSVFFGLLAMLAYLKYVKRPSIVNYTIIACAFACSLLSKPMLVTLPAVLLLLDYWPLKRLAVGEREMGRVVLEKLPLAVMSVASAIITVAAQVRGGSVSGIDALPFTSRIANAAVAYVMYLWQTIWPVKLAPLYPLTERWPAWVVGGSIVMLVMISVIVAALSRKRQYLVTGWLWYVGTLLPVIGLVQVGSQAHADRYTYFPHIGLLMMLVWSVPAPPIRAAQMSYAVIAVCICAVLAVLTHRQVAHWRNSIALSEHTLNVTHDNTYAHFNLANALLETGRTDEAVSHFQAAAVLKPNWADAPYNLGNAYLRLRQFDHAIAAFDEAIRRSSTHVAAHTNRAIALAQRGDMDAANESFERALQIDPNNRSALVNYGQTLARINKLEEAIGLFERALAIDADDAVAHLMIGNALARLDREQEALPHFSEALRLNPANPHAHMSMAAALAGRGNVAQAIAHLGAAEELARNANDLPLVREIQSRIERYQAAVKP
jgi:protein O-mannosyl-transferase